MIGARSRASLRALREDRGLRRRAAVTAWRLRRRFGELQAFCLFVGHPRSGHSLVGALLDAQPEAMIAHELDALGFIEEGERSRARLLALCVERNRWFAARGSRWNEFAYRVESGWQGRCRRFTVIGDKKGGRTTLRLRRRPELLDELRALVQVPLRLVHVVRHPLDNIATMSVKREEPLERTVEEYFERAAFLDAYLHEVPREELLTLPFEDFSREPVAHLRVLLGFVGLRGDEAATVASAAIVRREPSRSRERVEWSDALREEVRRRAAELVHLRRYADEPWT